MKKRYILAGVVATGLSCGDYASPKLTVPHHPVFDDLDELEARIVLYTSDLSDCDEAIRTVMKNGGYVVVHPSGACWPMPFKKKGRKP